MHIFSARSLVVVRILSAPAVIAAIVSTFFAALTVVSGEDISREYPWIPWLVYGAGLLLHFVVLTLIASVLADSVLDSLEVVRRTRERMRNEGR